MIEPALEAGNWVLCDRYTDSTEAYQGGGRKLGSDRCCSCTRCCADGLWPDLTILMDSDVALQRAAGAAAEQDCGPTAMLRTKTVSSARARRFFKRVHEAYLKIAEREKQRVVMVDARPPIEEVHREILGVVRERLMGHARNAALSARVICRGCHAERSEGPAFPWL